MNDPWALCYSGERCLPQATERNEGGQQSRVGEGVGETAQHTKGLRLCVLGAEATAMFEEEEKLHGR